LASLLDSRSDMPFARLFPFGVIKQQGSGASFSEISSHALLGCRLLTLLGGEGCGGGDGGGRRLPAHRYKRRLLCPSK
jgi:hypothetical protein